MDTSHNFMTWGLPSVTREETFKSSNSNNRTESMVRRLRQIIVPVLWVRGMALISPIQSWSFVSLCGFMNVEVSASLGMFISPVTEYMQQFKKT